ncbi:hypothetical protein [Natrinema sp. CBA1119]|uniref:hypothetical protein n=1 Tax=Natrinema sp. CBA1119 TaxID=1608465 RepID=UPI00159BBAE2|nr:hypothetical protein [Natrinema sp. CBA1119]
MDHESLPTTDSEESTRRTFMKQGATATAGLALVGAGAGTATAQDGGILDEGWEALIFANNFHPEARFTFVSGVVEWTPNYGDVRDSWFSEYNTYQIRWLNTGEVVSLFVSEDAEIGQYNENLGYIPEPEEGQNRPQVFEVNQEWTPFSDNQQLITINVNPADDEVAESILENDDWWQPMENNGGGDTTTNGGGGNNTTAGN